MKLLVITQKIDAQDPILGFFHNWLIKLSSKYEFITVICLGKGELSLPSNVKVLSLGKELGLSRFSYILNFYRYIWSEKNNYDSVFVHMNQEYVLLGWKLWKLWGKKIYMWRNHKEGSFLTRIAVLVSNKVFCTSSSSFTARFKKTVLMPVGIDTEKFSISNLELSNRKKNSILFLGRIAPVKKVDLFLEALKILKEKEIPFEAVVYGDALPKDEDYLRDLNYKNLALFRSAVPNSETPHIYASHTVYVNLTPSGSFDKTILEAAACGALPVIVNKSLEQESAFSYLISEPNAGDVADTIALWLKAEESTLIQKREALQKFVKEKHSLSLLIEKIAEIVK